MNDLFSLPFDEYMERRSQYAIDAARRSKVIDMDYGFLALLQAMWARDYWVAKNTGDDK